MERLPSIEENISLPPPPSIMFKHQAQTVGTLKQSVNEKKNTLSEELRNNGIHHWRITRHVFRSGLIFKRTRRASDSILPLLIKTHTADLRSRTDSVDSTRSPTPFENLVDYLTYEEENERNCLTVSKRRKRSGSDTSECIRQNKLEDSIFQYEMILQHLKNYNQFMSTCSVSPSSMFLKQREKSLDTELINTKHKLKEALVTKSPISNRQTQSLSRNVGRTFSEFIMTDLLLSLPASSSNEQKRLSFSHTSSQTDLSEPIHDIKDECNRINSISDEETKEVLNELDTMLDQQIPITPNSEINVIVLNSAVLSNTEVVEKEQEDYLFYKTIELFVLDTNNRKTTHATFV